MNEQEAAGSSSLFSLGTSTRPWPEFLDLLMRFHIACVADVRRFPTSRFEHFQRKNLEPGLRRHAVDYVWLGEHLGGFRRGGYLQYMKTEAFQQGLNALLRLARARVTVIICRERFPWKCHRRFIAMALESHGFTVRHILDDERVWIPRRRRGSKLSPGRIPEEPGEPPDG